MHLLVDGVHASSVAGLPSLQASGPGTVQAPALHEVAAEQVVVALQTTPSGAGLCVQVLLVGSQMATVQT